ncbi:MAG: hypothetical protein GY884_21005 [Proteobacteria bacterium]|nr:hypothetical protein [Pseudomonadota bacterium]
MIHAVAAGLRALRLNRHYPPWRELAGHVLATGDDTTWCPRTGWPAPCELVRVRVDRDLAPSLLARMAFLESQGVATEKARGLRALLAADLLGPGGLRIDTVHAEDRRFELVLDRVELALPVFVRWTLRVEDPDGRIPLDPDRPTADPALERLLLALSDQPVATAMRWLREHEGLHVTELVRGELGPVRPGPNGPRITASLSRASVDLRGVLVDDPLAGDMPVPGPAHGFGLSHQRKWAVHPDDLRSMKAWLRERGSRNVAYAWRKRASETTR